MHLLAVVCDASHIVGFPLYKVILCLQKLRLKYNLVHGRGIFQVIFVGKSVIVQNTSTINME